MNPTDLRYSEEHEWVRVEPGDVAFIGLTEFAAESLGDVVFLDLPEVNTEISQFGKLGEVESVKAVEEVYAPVGGRVLELNQQAIDNPELVNDSPYESGWLLKLALSDPAEVEKLMTSDEYEALLASQDS